jgi:hypothetical protein
MRADQCKRRRGSADAGSVRVKGAALKAITLARARWQQSSRDCAMQFREPVARTTISCAVCRTREQVPPECWDPDPSQHRCQRRIRHWGHCTDCSRRTDQRPMRCSDGTSRANTSLAHRSDGFASSSTSRRSCWQAPTRVSIGSSRPPLLFDSLVEGNAASMRWRAVDRERSDNVTRRARA